MEEMRRNVGEMEERYRNHEKLQRSHSIDGEYVAQHKDDIIAYAYKRKCMVCIFTFR
jgi:hypothetical protein